MSGFRKSTTGSGTISTITSTDSTVTVTDPTGPSTNLKVAGVDGVIITGTPTVGQVPTATSGTAADWATPSGGSGITTLTSTDFTVTNATGPTANLDGPLLANLAAGGFKLTGLANGSGAADSAAFGQLPTLASLGIPLAVVTYAPTSLATYSITTTTFAAIDSTNLTISFTTNAAGAGSTVVLVRLYNYNNSGTGSGLWCILNHSGGAQLGFGQILANGNAFATSWAVCLRISGLTASTSYQFDWGARVSSGTMTFYSQGVTNAASVSACPSIMEVWPGL